MTDYSQWIGSDFLLGSHLCREPMPPMSELKADMKILKAHGFNTIKLQEHWQIDEAEEGKYDFSRHEELIEQAAKLDLGVYLGLTMEQAPHWLYRKYPDGRLVGFDGRSVMYEAVCTMPSDGKPGPCFDHPGVREEQRRFIQALVARLGRHENIIVWNVWQEIATNSWSSSLADMRVCFCEHTLSFFQTWLRERHGDLDALNRAWNTRHARWEDVLPERCSHPGPYAVNIAWLYFMDNVHISRILDERRRAIQAADPRKRPVFAHRNAPDIGSPRDWNFARKLDFLSSSCYPSRGEGTEHPWDDRNVGEDVDPSVPNPSREMRGIVDEIMLRADHIRSCNAAGDPLWLAEVQGGPKNIGLLLEKVPTAADIRRWMLAGAAQGLTGIHFWVTRAEIVAQECNGYSLLDSEGDTSPRMEEAGRIGSFLREHADVFAQPPASRAEVGILIDEWNFKLCELMNLSGFSPREHLQYSIRGWYRMLWERNVPVDFVDLASDSSEWSGNYKVLVYPFPVSVSEKAAAKLDRYVRDGGNLVSEAMPGKLDENAFARRGELSPILRELFGVRHKRTVMVSEPEGGNRWTRKNGYAEWFPPTKCLGTGELEGQSLRANLYLEEFTPTEAKACLLWEDRVVGTHRNVGKGGAWLIGTIVGHNGTAYGDAETRNGIMRILENGGIVPTHRGKLVTRKRAAGKKEIRFLTNPYSSPVTEEIDIAGRPSARTLNGAALTVNGDTVSVTVAPGDIEVLLQEA
ncbi:MAG: beta-galactosidase [Phycisphaerae bacterium]|nr:beta-galactosidase [Phycisphaerae bacterium]